jgi:hypothetical protein
MSCVGTTSRSNLTARNRGWGIWRPLVVFVVLLLAPVFVLAGVKDSDSACPRPSSGSEVPEPINLRSQNGTLQFGLIVRNVREADDSIRYRYLVDGGAQSPTLRVKPGDLVIVKFKNELRDLDAATAPERTRLRARSSRPSDPCESGLMSPTSTNLHFHGMTIPPVCHQMRS